MQHSAAKHLEFRDNLCRICGFRARSQPSVKPRKLASLCTRYKSEMHLFFRVDISLDNEAHSKVICSRCTSRIKNMQRRPATPFNLESARKLGESVTHIWRLYNSKESVAQCSLCAHALSLRTRGKRRDERKWRCRQVPLYKKPSCVLQPRPHQDDNDSSADDFNNVHDHQELFIQETQQSFRINMTSAQQIEQSIDPDVTRLQQQQQQQQATDPNVAPIQCAQQSVSPNVTPVSQIQQAIGPDRRPVQHIGQQSVSPDLTSCQQIRVPVRPEIALLEHIQRYYYVGPNYVLPSQQARQSAGMNVTALQQIGHLRWPNLIAMSQPFTMNALAGNNRFVWNGQPHFSTSAEQAHNPNVILQPQFFLMNAVVPGRIAVHGHQPSV